MTSNDLSCSTDITRQILIAEYKRVKHQTMSIYSAFRVNPWLQWKSTLPMLCLDLWRGDTHYAALRCVLRLKPNRWSVISAQGAKAVPNFGSLSSLPRSSPALRLYFSMCFRNSRHWYCVASRTASTRPDGVFPGAMFTIVESVSMTFHDPSHWRHYQCSYCPQHLDLRHWRTEGLASCLIATEGWADKDANSFNFDLPHSLLECYKRICKKALYSSWDKSIFVEIRSFGGFLLAGSHFAERSAKKNYPYEYKVSSAGLA